MEIHVTIADEPWDNFQDKLKECGINPSTEEILNNAICLLAWAIDKTNSGKVIGSFKESDSSFNEVRIPLFDSIIDIKTVKN